MLNDSPVATIRTVGRPFFLKRPIASRSLDASADAWIPDGGLDGSDANEAPPDAVADAAPEAELDATLDVAVVQQERVGHVAESREGFGVIAAERFACITWLVGKTLAAITSPSKLFALKPFDEKSVCRFSTTELFLEKLSR